MPGQHKLFARHRWVLAWQPLLELALLMGTCNLLPVVMPAWLEAIHAPVAKQTAPNAAAAAEAQNAADTGPVDADGDAIIPFDGDVNVVMLSAGGLSTEAYRERNEKQQGKAKCFAEDRSSLPHLLLVAIYSKPMVHLSARVLRMDSEQWDKEQI